MAPGETASHSPYTNAVSQHIENGKREKHIKKKNDVCEIQASTLKWCTVNKFKNIYPFQFQIKMKLKFYILTLLLFFSLKSVAQNGYYYYKGKKISLTIDENYSNQNNIYFKRANNVKPIPISDIFYVKLHKSSDLSQLQQTANQKNASIVHKNSFMPLWYKLKLNTNNNKSSLQVCNEFYETGKFADVDPAFMFNFDNSCSNDSDFGDLWGLNNTSNSNIDINICDAWSITEGSGINVAVLDQGIDKTHNDLSDNITSLSFDTQNGTSPSVFTNGRNHGTHVAGTIGAEKDNNLQVVGVAPQSEIMSISHTLSITPDISEELANGINWAWQNGAHIINNSWGDQGGQFFNQLHSAILEDAINNALNNGRNGLGTVLVFASGNRSPVIDYPANSNPSITTVGAITSTGNRSNFSGFGNELDVVAPGSNILSTTPNQSTASWNGTSMAAPHVAGIAALILSVNPNLTVQEVNTIIESTAQKVGGYSYSNNPNRPNGTWDDEMGYGLVDAYASVQMAQQQTACTEKPQITVELDPIGSNYVAVHMVGLNGTDINSQCITSTTWQKISSSGGCYASFGGSGFDGLGHGNCNSWSVYAKITATNSNGTTTIYRTITPPAPDPCRDSYRIGKSSGYHTYRIIIAPCRSSSAFSLSNNLNSKSIENQKVMVYNHYGNLVFITKEIEFDLSFLKEGIYFIKAYVNKEIITHKIIR
ncbi:MAG: S8 family serine peptidase [Jejuia sp.]